MSLPDTATTPASPNSDSWEAAFLAFETPEQELRKFLARLRFLGAHTWPREAKIVELFCGRGNGMVALEQLGFKNLEGVDLSARLAGEYRGHGKIHVGDCRELPFEDSSRDIAIVQGGLHHLPKLPDDLDRALGEVKRILRPGGRFVAVEPWLTPFLRGLHLLTTNKLARKLSTKLDAYQTLTDHEIVTFNAWLAARKEIIGLLDKHFQREHLSFAWGKIRFIGRVKT